MTAPTVELELSAWLRARGEATAPPVIGRRIGTGQSNLAYLLSDDEEREWVLRHPPPGSAVHNVEREARILRGLAESPIPVPRIVGVGSDEAGIEGPFLVMRREAGAPLEAEGDAARLSAGDCARLAGDVVRILADLHALDPDEVGLGDLGPLDGYLDRQIRRTARNWDSWGAGSPADPAWRHCLRAFEAGMPSPQRTAIVHGDYRLSNLLVADGRVGAVLDWELCTLGDPLVDLAWLADDWRSSDEPGIAIPCPTRAGGFLGRQEIIEDYARRSRLDVGEIDRYRAFTHWKAATLLQGVLIRRRSGAMGKHGSLDLNDLERSIAALLDETTTLT